MQKSQVMETNGCGTGVWGIAIALEVRLGVSEGVACELRPE